MITVIVTGVVGVLAGLVIGVVYTFKYAVKKYRG
jgi:hypothetical protein